MNKAINRTIQHLMIDHEPPLNQLDLARLVDVSPRFIGLLLTGGRKSRRVTKEVAAVLGISTQRMARLVRGKKT